MARVSTRVAFPAAGLRGAVDGVPGGVVSLNFILPDARGGYGRYRQRMLNYVDIPLGLAITLGFLPLAWRRRLPAAAITVLLIFAEHVGLVIWTAGKLGGVMGNPALSRLDVERLLPASVQAIRSWGDVSLLLTLGFVGASIGLLWPRGAPPGASGAARPAGPAGSSAAGRGRAG